MDLIHIGEIEMTKDRKIVFFDIDGTIYMYNKGIPKDTIQAIKQLRENGHIAVICTGRTKSIVFSEILNIGFDGIIAGAGTYAEYNGEEIYRYVLDKDLLNETVDAMKKHNIWQSQRELNVYALTLKECLKSINQYMTYILRHQEII